MRRTVLLAGLAAFPSLIAAQAPPPAEAAAQAALDVSPRHGEWVDYDAGDGDRVRAWVVYPERSDAAPVVVVVHEIYGMTDWIRSVADRLADDGYIAVAPDLLSGHGVAGGNSDSLDRQGAVAAVRELDAGEVRRRLEAAARYGSDLPSASGAVGAIGFCWGGSTTFLMATTSDLDAAVVFYGGSPEGGYSGAATPVLGLYGGDDNRVNATIPRAREGMAEAGIAYEALVFEGAGHGFLRAQDGRDGANARAANSAWPRTLTFLAEHLGG